MSWCSVFRICTVIRSMSQTSAAPGAHFDAVALTSLLNASFALWCVSARAETECGGALAARVHCAQGRVLRVLRVDEGARGLPAWCHGSVDMPLAVAPQAASLVALLRELRMDLDIDFAPHAALIGARQLRAR